MAALALVALAVVHRGGSVVARCALDASLRGLLKHHATEAPAIPTTAAAAHHPALVRRGDIGGCEAVSRRWFDVSAAIERTSTRCSSRARAGASNLPPSLRSMLGENRGVTSLAGAGACGVSERASNEAARENSAALRAFSRPRRRAI